MLWLPDFHVLSGQQYTYRIEWSEEDQAHLARCLEFPSLVTHGKTPEKALKEIEVVVTESIKWIEEEEVFLFGVVRIFHRPHPSPDTDKGAVSSIRKWLEENGVAP